MNMTPSQDSKDPHQDDMLADFTDRVLKGQVDQAEANADPQLRRLEETVLQLNRTLPQGSLSDADIKKMWVRLNARARRETQKEEAPFWKRWFLPNHVRPQFGMALGFVTMLVLLAVVIPAFSTEGGSTIGTALTSSQGLATVLVLVGVIFLIFWFMRRK
jgi:hypothetical protein